MIKTGQPILASAARRSIVNMSATSIDMPIDGGVFIAVATA